MGLLDKFKGKVANSVEGVAINWVIKAVEDGRYGDRTRRVWFALKGKKTLIGWLMFALGGAIALWPSPETIAFGSTLAILGSYLGRFGLIAKGADHTPPPFPEDLRPAFEFVLSASTYITELLTAAGGLLVLSGHEGAYGVSLNLVIVGQGISTATGYLSTLIGRSPAERKAAE